MSASEARLPRSLSVIETWGFGFTVLLFWLVVAPEVHATLGAGSLLVWLPAAAAGIVVNLQIRRLALDRPGAAGGSPVYVARLWSDRPLVARWAGLAYFHSWAIVPPAISWVLADLAVRNLAEVGHVVPAPPIQLVILGAIYLIAFSGVRVLSVVHLFFLIPSLGLLLALGAHGVGWLVVGAGSPGFFPSEFTLPSWSAWVAGYFVVAYTTYGIETAAAFSADSRNPRATVNCLLAAAVLILPIMVGGSWVLARTAPAEATGSGPAMLLELASSPLWGGFTPFAVTFMLASSMLLACATSVALTPRVAWQLSRDGVLAPIFGRLHGPAVPRIALAFAVGVALLHIGLDPVEMILVGGASWVGFWSLMHLGLWRRRGDPKILWPRLALGLGIIEALVLAVGGWLAGGWWVAVGLGFPFLLVGFDAGIRRFVPVLSEPADPPEEDSAGSQALEIVLVVALILAAVIAGWLAGSAIGPPGTPPTMRIFVIVLLISAFVGVSWASWTSLRRLGLLERARTQLDDVIDTAMDAVIVVDRRGRIRTANPAAEHLLGETEARLRGRPLPELVPGLEGDPDSWAAWREWTIPSVLGPRTVELAARHHATVPWGEFTVTIRDLTERNQVEEALRDSEERLDLALDAARAGVWDYDVRTGRVTRSRQWTTLLGYAPETVEESREGWAALVHPEDRERVLDAFRAHVDGRTEAYESEHRLRRADGAWLWVLDRGRVLERDTDGAALRMLGTTADIADRKRLEQQLTQAQKMEAVGRLAGGVAHDFNNVLTAILGTTELLLAGKPPLSKTQLEDIGDIREAATRASQITQQLLAFSRRQQLRPRVVDLNHAVERVERLLQRLIGEDVLLETDRHPRLGAIRADPIQLEQAIVNLALNARDAMPGGGRVTISTRPARLPPPAVGTGEGGGSAGDDEAGPDRPGGRGVPPGDQDPDRAGVELAVSDTGQGMDARTRERIFEPFYTTKGPGKGTGLGLAMVYGFVRQSGGRVSVESGIGEGTTIRLVFPAVSDVPTPRSAPLRRDPVPPGTETVLLAEDEPLVRSLVRRILRKEGYQVLEAADGEEALEVAALHPGPIHLLLSDLVMPRMGGRELAALLRERNPAVRVLFMSGYPSDPIHARTPSGTPPFLQKPFVPEVLVRKVRAALEGEAWLETSEESSR